MASRSDFCNVQDKELNSETSAKYFEQSLRFEINHLQILFINPQQSKRAGFAVVFEVCFL